VQSGLKKVQLAIHPDRVAQHPHAHAANTAAFAALQSYLRALRGDVAAAMEAAQMYHLDFYAWLHDVDPTGAATQERHNVSAGCVGASGTATVLRDPRNWAPGRAPDAPAQRTTSSKSQSASPENRDSQTHAGNPVDLSDAEAKLRRVTMRLPPPPCGCSEQLPRSVRRALAGLFRSLHLPEVFDEPKESSSVRLQ
jgi:Domain of unknown function (DUF4460)